MESYENSQLKPENAKKKKKVWGKTECNEYKQNFTNVVGMNPNL